MAKGGGKGEAKGDAKGGKGEAGHAEEVPAETPGRSGVKRRAQGLHLSRYLPQKPAGRPDVSDDGRDHESHDPAADEPGPEDPAPTLRAPAAAPALPEPGGPAGRPARAAASAG